MKSSNRLELPVPLSSTMFTRLLPADTQPRPVTMCRLSECFCNVTAYEIAYSRSPQGMKTLVMALFLFTNALSSALGEVISPAIEDPHLIWVWGGPAIALAVQTVIFWFRYKHLNEDEFMTYEDQYGSQEALEESKDNVHVPETIPEEASVKNEKTI